MTPFEYVSVLVSIILGLGITLVLTGIAEIIRRWKKITHFWPYLVWVLLVFVLHIHEWWIMYELKSVTNWPLPFFLFVILYPILLFILANLLFPHRWSKRHRNLRAFYFESYPRFMICAMALITTAVLSDIFLAHRNVSEQIVKIILFGLLLGVYLRRPTQPVVHGTLALLFLALLITGLIVDSDHLIIR